MRILITGVLAFLALIFATDFSTKGMKSLVWTTSSRVV